MIKCKMPSEKPAIKAITFCFKSLSSFSKSCQTNESDYSWISNIGTIHCITLEELTKNKIEVIWDFGLSNASVWYHQVKVKLNAGFGKLNRGRRMLWGECKIWATISVQVFFLVQVMAQNWFLIAVTCTRRCCNRQNNAQIIHKSR